MIEPFAPSYPSLYRPVQDETVNHGNGACCAVATFTHLAGIFQFIHDNIYGFQVEVFILREFGMKDDPH